MIRRAAWLLAEMSPNPTVVKTVTEKYNASVRVSGSVKFVVAARAIKTYVDANRSRQSGMVNASASATRSPGSLDLVTRRTRHPMITATTAQPTLISTTVAASTPRSNGTT